MLEFLHSLGLPQNLSLQGEYIDNANVLMHWLMLYLFIGWGAFFIVSLYKFRASKNKKADYYGVKSHLFPVPVSVMRLFAKLLGRNEIADRLFGDLQVDSSNARELLGWKPVVTMDEQLRKMANAQSKAKNL